MSLLIFANVCSDAWSFIMSLIQVSHKLKNSPITICIVFLLFVWIAGAKLNYMQLGCYYSDIDICNLKLKVSFDEKYNTTFKEVKLNCRHCKSDYCNIEDENNKSGSFGGNMHVVLVAIIGLLFYKNKKYSL